MSHIFISYSRKDLTIAERIIDALAKDDLEPWIDWKSIPKGETFEREIQQGIEATEIFLFLVSPDSVQSHWCNKEIDHAVKNGKRILPIVICDTDPKSIHPEISKRNWIFCREGQDDFNKAIEETRKTIHTDYEWLKYHTGLQVKALKWEQQKDTSRLLRGKELREAEQQLAEISNQEDPQPTKLQREYILASQRNEVRTRRQIIIGLVVGLGIMVVLSFVAWGQRNSAISAQHTAVAEANARATAQANAETQARIAHARELEMAAIRNFQYDPELGLLLSLHAISLASSENDIPYESKNTLYYSLPYSRLKRIIIPSKTWSIGSLSFSPDGKTLAVSGSSFEIFDMGGNLVVTIPKNPILGNIDFSPDGKRLAVVHNSGEIWDKNTGNKLLSLIPSSEELSANYTNEIKFNFDGSLVATANRKYVTIWDSKSGNEFKTLSSHEALIDNIVFNPVENSLAVLFNDGIVEFWNITSAETKITVASDVDRITAIAFSPNGKTLAMADIDGTIKLWEMASGNEVVKFNSYSSVVNSIDFSNNGKLMATGGSDGIARLWSVETRTSIFTVKADSNSVLFVAIDSDNHNLATVGSDNTVKIWDITPWTLATILESSSVMTNDVAFSPTDRDKLVSVRQDGLANIWNISTMKLEISIQAHIKPIHKVIFSPDGSRFVTASDDGTAKIWDVDSGQLILTLSNTKGGIRDMVYTPDGLYLYTFGTQDLECWDAKTGKELSSNISRTVLHP